MIGALDIARLGTALGCCLVGGAFFAFSTFIMKALARLPPGDGIAAMQSINVAVFDWRFMGALFGTAIACVLLVVTAVRSWSTPGAPFVLAGCALYLVGTILVTILFNVPRNEMLAALDPQQPEAAARWQRYVAEWTAWNHVRTGAAVLAAAAITIGMLRGAR